MERTVLGKYFGIPKDMIYGMMFEHIDELIGAGVDFFTDSKGRRNQYAYGLDKSHRYGIRVEYHARNGKLVKWVSDFSK